MAKIFTEIKERILQIPKLQGIAIEIFFEKVGLKYGNYKGKAKESVIGADAVAIILTKCPEISPDWLILGKGPMLRTTATANDNDSLQIDAGKLTDRIDELEDNLETKKKLIMAYEEKIARLESKAIKPGKQIASAK